MIPLYLPKKSRYVKAGVSGTNRLITYEEDEYMSKNIHRGELYFADLNPVVGSEQGGYRPVLVIQNDVGNYYSSTVIVAALSGRVNTKNDLPTHHVIRNYPGLSEDSVILLEQIRTIDKKRLKNYIGVLGEKDMNRVDYCLIVSLGLNLR